MPKSSPEKLAAALRANLKRRKETKPAPSPPASRELPPEAAARPAKKPPKS
jgi:hypothetical protein